MAELTVTIIVICIIVIAIIENSRISKKQLQYSRGEDRVPLSWKRADLVFGIHTWEPFQHKGYRNHPADLWVFGLCGVDGADAERAPSGASHEARLGVWQDFSGETGEGSWPHEPPDAPRGFELEPRGWAFFAQHAQELWSITHLRGRGFSKASFQRGYSQ